MTRTNASGRGRVRVLLVAALLGSGGCNGSSATSPTSPTAPHVRANLSGRWVGAINITKAPLPTPMVVDLTDAGGTLTDTGGGAPGR